MKVEFRGADRWSARDGLVPQAGRTRQMAGPRGPRAGEAARPTKL